MTCSAPMPESADAMRKIVDIYSHKRELITDHVIEAQSLQVDIISGATSSSKVILKAIEEALLSAAEKV